MLLSNLLAFDVQSKSEKPSEKLGHSFDLTVIGSTGSLESNILNFEP